MTLTCCPSSTQDPNTLDDLVLDEGMFEQGTLQRTLDRSESTEEGKHKGRPTNKVCDCLRYIVEALKPLLLSISRTLCVDSLFLFLSPGERL